MDAISSNPEVGSFLANAAFRVATKAMTEEQAWTKFRREMWALNGVRRIMGLPKLPVRKSAFDAFLDAAPREVTLAIAAHHAAEGERGSALS